ncbi:hypothetical protein FOZ63_004420 [Perkinsus olseni]|uniref:SET domain-containing protein n=1 Tax=Perkinsus olseni TaxID=32597 RepID=A0A7J6RTT1_PEROL|nr:hypothetical protein FOZ63_004420 [Perkinsus olseni]
MPPCVRVDKVSPDVGLGLYYNNTTATSIGDVLYKDRPLFHIQHTANRRYVTACQTCSKIIDNTVLQLQTILDEDAFREAQYQVYELGRESGALPDNNSMVKCRCGEIYCSEECRVSAYKKHHWALCVADEATDDEAVGDAYNLLADAFMSKKNEILGYLLSDKCDYGGRRLYENIVGMFDMNNIDIEIHNAKAKKEVSELVAAAAASAANGGNANREMAATVTNVLCNILREKQVALSMWSSEMEGVYEDDDDDQEEEDNDDDMMSDVVEHDDVEHEQLVAEELAQLREQARGVALAELVQKDFPSFHGTGFYSTVARMNHSCCPNAKVVFNNTTNEMEVVSLAPIKYGDELRISYVPIHLDVNTRRHRLKDYGFYCNCDRCVTEQQQQQQQQQQAAFYGVPEWNIDPTKNQWRWCVDPAWYGGMRDKANMDMYRLMVYPFFGYALLYLHSRFKQNDKYNVFAKWRKDDDDQQE